MYSIAMPDFTRGEIEEVVKESWKLRGANLAGIDLSGAILGGANLSGANLHEAWYNRHTTFPDGFDPQKVGMLPLYDGELPKGSH